MKDICILLTVILLCGCLTHQKTCDAPNTMIAGSCCLDADKNKECDAAETTTKTARTSTSAAQHASSTTTMTFSKSTTLPKNVGSEIESPWAESTPRMDGVKSPGEWSDARLLLSSNLDRLYVKNNDLALFFLYESLDARKFSNETTLYVDPDSDGLYDYAVYDNKIFLVYPLVRGFSENRTTYCGSHMIMAHESKSCGESYENIMENSRIAPRKTSTAIVSEVAIPLGNRTLHARNGTVYFFVLYGYPTMTCYPESMQCYDKPKFAKLQLAVAP
jgi:hypothetical protein